MWVCVRGRQPPRLKGLINKVICHLEPPVVHSHVVFHSRCDSRPIHGMQGMPIHFDQPSMEPYNFTMPRENMKFSQFGQMGCVKNMFLHPFYVDHLKPIEIPRKKVQF